MKNYKLLYFEGCPNYKPAKKLLDEIDLDFISICQDNLDETNPLKNYSSPTLLRGNQIVFGSEAIGGGCSMPLPSKDELLKRLL